MSTFKSTVVTGFTAAFLALSAVAAAHCDSVDGPVVRDARTALEKQDPAAVLKWVTAESEQEIREAFAETLAVRILGKDAAQLADQWFFETLVRVHRAGEGEPFTGLKAAGHIDPAIAQADSTLQSGSSARLAKELALALEKGVQERFDHASALRRHAADNVAAGRGYVSAYVDYIHFVESAHRLVQEGVSHQHIE
jgi:hypothetical protein